MRQNDDRLSKPEAPKVPQSNVGLMNYVVPTEVVDLPSKGVFYPKGHPLHNQEFVEIKHMTAKEEDILTSTSLITKGVVLDHLIQSLLLDKNINARTLFTGDRNAILVNICRPTAKNHYYCEYIQAGSQESLFCKYMWPGCPESSFL